MAVPLILMGVGTGMKMASDYNSNMTKGIQGYKNAKWLQEQADFARESMHREIRRTEQEYTNKIGQQIGDYAASGVDMSGSAANTVGGTYSGAMLELAAVRRKGELDYKLAHARAMLEKDNSDAYTNPGMNAMQMGGTMLSAYASTDGFGGGLKMPAGGAGGAPPAGRLNSSYISKYG